MARTRRREKKLAAVHDSRLDKARDEKRRLKHLMQEYRNITRLTKQLQRAIERADVEMEGVWLWLGQRVAKAENDKSQRTGTEG